MRQNTIASFYSHGFVGTIKDWIESKCEVNPSIMSSYEKYDKQSITTITGAISKVIKRVAKAMKKIMNDVQNIVQDMLHGF